MTLVIPEEKRCIIIRCGKDFVAQPFRADKDVKEFFR